MLDRDLKKGWIGNDNGVWALTRMELPLGQKKIVINEQRPAYLFLGGNAGERSVCQHFHNDFLQ